jgi:DNA-binding transcriptional LysR family regulator
MSMQALDLDQLRTFLVVLDAGSLTAAAPRVFLSQSAVSEQMRKLEECAGQSLLSRSKAGVLPTAAGERLKRHAQQLVALADEALRDLRGESLQGELRLAVTDYFRPGDLTRLLARLAQGHPGMRLNVTIKKSSEVEAMHTRGELDIGLSMRVAEGAGAKSAQKALRREPLAWMASAGWRPIPPGSRGEPLPLLVLPETCSLRQFTEQVLQKRRVSYRVAHVASGVAGLQSAVAAGLGVACLNASSLAEGMALLTPPHGLPALPRVDFHFLPPRRGESELVGRVRELLTQQLA